MNPNIKITGDSGIMFAEKNDGEHPTSRQLEKVNVFGKLPSILKSYTKLLLLSYKVSHTVSFLIPYYQLE